MKSCPKFQNGHQHVTTSFSTGSRASTRACLTSFSEGNCCISFTGTIGHCNSFCITYGWMLPRASHEPDVHAPPSMRPRTAYISASAARYCCYGFIIETFSCSWLQQQSARSRARVSYSAASRYQYLNVSQSIKCAFALTSDRVWSWR